MDRVQIEYIVQDLEKKMVLLVGPRQAGKTWIAKEIAKRFPNSVYLNYDQSADRKIINEQSWLDSVDLLILDELHKMPEWKNYLKGLYDTKPESMRIIVTGSARLDIYDQLGDSLAGRYFKHRLLPISLAELKQTKNNNKNNNNINIKRLIEYSGFPEPYQAQNLTEANRWRLQYINSLLSSDVFTIDKIHNLQAMQLVFKLLTQRVGSPVSYQSLAEDVAVSPTTIKKYIQILEALYIIFRVTPYSKNIARSLLKEPKIYFFDTGLVQGDLGIKLENLIAVSLLKHVCAMVDYQAKPYALHYLRTKEGLEVDFALVCNESVELIIEVKLSDKKPSKGLLKFNKKYNYTAVQLVQSLRTEYTQDNIKILKAEKFLEDLLFI